MKNYFFYVMLSPIFIACNSVQPPQNIHTEDYVPMTGKKVYETYCVACHGADGKMGFSGAKDLSVSTLNIEERELIIKHGRGVMNPFKNVITEEEISRVALYIDTLRVK